MRYCQWHPDIPPAQVQYTQEKRLYRTPCHDIQRRAPPQPSRLLHFHPRLLRVRPLFIHPPHSLCRTEGPLGLISYSAGTQYPLENIPGYLWGSVFGRRW